MTTSKPQQDPDRYLKHSVQDLLSLKGRTIVITGGARGLGLAFALAVIEVGGNVAVLDAADKPHEHFYQIQKNFDAKLEFYKTDVTKYDQLKNTFDQVVADFGRIDGLITAAGICPDEPFLERAPESVARCIDINVLGTYYAAQLAAAQMDKQEPTEFNPRGGSIVMIASIAAYVASKGQATSDYCASKGAVLSLAKALGVELAAKGIRVNSISPGYMVTDMTVDICKRVPFLGDIMNTEPPMKRMGDRTDLKVPVVYLLSEASAYHTSDDILITGGIHAGQLLFSGVETAPNLELVLHPLWTPFDFPKPELLQSGIFAEGEPIVMSDPPAAKFRRKHVTMACVPCRVGKVKCDGASPICSSCENKGKECRYPTGDDKRKLTPRTAIELLLSRIEQLCQFIIDNGQLPPPMVKRDHAALVRVFGHLKLAHNFDNGDTSTNPLSNSTTSHRSPNQNHMLELSQSRHDTCSRRTTGQSLDSNGSSRTTCDNVNKERSTRLNQVDMTAFTTGNDLSLSVRQSSHDQPPNWVWNATGELNFNFQPPITVEADALLGILPFSTPEEQQQDNQHGNIQQSDEALSDTESTEALIDKLSERVGSLRIGPSGQIRYYGPFSNFNLMDVPARDTSSSYRNIRGDGKEHLDRLGIGKEVPIELEDHLENLYFSWQDPALHVVDRDMFEEAKINWRLNQEETPYYSEALQNSICSLGAAFESRHHPTFVTFPKSLSDFFADRAKALLEIELDSPSLATIQAMIMLSGHDISSKRDSRGWLYIGMAMRLAFDMALHLDMTEYVAKRSLTQAEADLRKDIFWAAYTVDHMWGFYLGRPFRINMEDVTVEKPRGGIEPESAGQWIPYIAPRSLGENAPIPGYTNELHRQRVLMSEIVAPVGYALYGNLRISKSALQVMNAKTVAELLDWKASLPHVLQIDTNDFETLMQYHQNIIHAHRPWMSRTYVQPSPQQGPGAGHARKMFQEVVTPPKIQQEALGPPGTDNADTGLDWDWIFTGDNYLEFSLRAYDGY
ncbi:hypothetical protein G7Z17_g3452 [Cylindrodendrum hubeiense]|uniref:Zn(2)-C6 fungal-type domain-containing protein n=1 Tax=Cylindrodendrum hubeiense TaxID=595255 RepID=A0A9P5HIT4_9HYPO|nr:hypothetical protein G7Z17_g3452 [Cylindrodendrum hubeiense]